MNKHSIKEDFIALLTGTFLVAQGIMFLHQAELITGGTAGLALLLSQVLPVSFGWIYFSVNVPFYIMAWKRFGSAFALNTLFACFLVSLFSDMLPRVVELGTINPIYSATTGGVLMGIGMLILFRHRASLGGFNVLCLWIQDRWGISVGKTQVILDSGIVIASLFHLPTNAILISVFGAVILNCILAMNHKPSRYSVKYG
ncbi:YitT family protein [Vibrio sp. RC27]